MHVAYLPLSLSTLGLEIGSGLSLDVEFTSLSGKWAPGDVRVSSRQRLQMFSTMPSLTWG